MNAHARIYDPSYVDDVLRDLEAYVRVAGLTPETRRRAEVEAVAHWRTGHTARHAATLIADKLGANR
jgi:hypothetical protein